MAGGMLGFNGKAQEADKPPDSGIPAVLYDWCPTMNSSAANAAPPFRAPGPLLGLAERAEALVAPPDGFDNVGWRIAWRAWRRHLHGNPGRALVGSAALAVVSAALVQTSSFSFAVWHTIYMAYLAAPLMRLDADFARMPELATAPLDTDATAAGIARGFGLVAVWAAVPHALYWVSAFALAPLLHPWFMAGRAAAALEGAVCHLALMLGALWLLMWARLSVPAGSRAVRAAFSALAWVAGLPYLMIDGPDAAVTRVFGSEPWPVSAPLVLAAFALWTFGALTAYEWSTRLPRWLADINAGAPAS